MATKIPILGAPKPPTDSDAEHAIAIEFPDDHSIEGMKIRAVGITAEQIFVACMHLQRVAMMTLANRDRVAQQAEAEALAVQQQLAREKGN